MGLIMDKYFSSCCTDDYDEISDIYNTAVEEQVEKLGGYMFGDDSEDE